MQSPDHAGADPDRGQRRFDLGIKRGLNGGEKILRVTAAILCLVGIGIAGYVVVTVKS